MSTIVLRCSFCRKSFSRDLQRINEGRRFGWKTYCSLKCLGLSRRTAKKYTCSRPGCRNTFIRTPSCSIRSKCYYCSLRCAALVNNLKYPKRRGIVKVCAYCGKNFTGNQKYCSRLCKDRGETIPSGEILKYIREFVLENGRIPFKREFKHAKAARLRFRTWNKAIEAAGFSPNPVMFAKKHIALDGHRCDSLAEMIIDNYLFRRKIKHEKNYPYPGNKGFTVDFKAGDNWIEFFGLRGELKRYDLLARRKLYLAKKYNLNLLSLYPKDLFPKGKLQEILNRI